MRRVGFLLVAAGLIVLGYVGWELYGTTWVANHRQQEEVAITQQVWSAENGSISEQDQELADGVIALVHIPAFGNDYTVPAHAGTSDEVLAAGFGIFAGSADPGGVGNFVLAGHRVTHGEPLRNMPDLEPGDLVEVETEDVSYTYTLDTAGDALTVGINDTWVTQPSPVAPTGEKITSKAGSHRLLTLVTCSELFHTDDRLVAFGHLTGKRATG